jgi:hypothetical protein
MALCRIRTGDQAKKGKRKGNRPPLLRKEEENGYLEMGAYLNNAQTRANEENGQTKPKQREKKRRTRKADKPKRCS